MLADDVPPSPKLQLYDATVPAEMVVESVNIVLSPKHTAGVLNFTTGAGLIVIEVEVESVQPELEVTVNHAV